MQGRLDVVADERVLTTLLVVLCNALHTSVRVSRMAICHYNVETLHVGFVPNMSCIARALEQDSQRADRLITEYEEHNDQIRLVKFRFRTCGKSTPHVVITIIFSCDTRITTTLLSGPDYRCFPDAYAHAISLIRS